MPNIVKTYVRIVDRVSHAVGLVAMYMIFAMIGVLLWSSINKAFFLPTLWTFGNNQR